MSEAKSKQVLIKSDIKDRLALSLLNVLQGNLKELPDENYKKLRRSILKHGFMVPLFVWEDKKSSKIYLVDGTQRFLTLNLMKDEGYKIPQIPVIFIPASNMDDAKNKLLAITSQYGKITNNGMEEFLATFKFDDSLFETIELPTLDMSFFQNIKTTEVSAHEREINNTGKELDLDSFDNFQHECPKCGFEWNNKK